MPSASLTLQRSARVRPRQKTASFSACATLAYKNEKCLYENNSCFTLCGRPMQLHIFAVRHRLHRPATHPLTILTTRCQLSAVTQNRPLMVEIKGFKTSHSLGVKTSLIRPITAGREGGWPSCGMENQSGRCRYAPSTMRKSRSAPDPSACSAFL